MSSISSNLERKRVSFEADLSDMPSSRVRRIRAKELKQPLPPPTKEEARVVIEEYALRFKAEYFEGKYNEDRSLRVQVAKVLDGNDMERFIRLIAQSELPFPLANQLAILMLKVPIENTPLVLSHQTIYKMIRIANEPDEQK